MFSHFRWVTASALSLGLMFAADTPSVHAQYGNYGYGNHGYGYGNYGYGYGNHRHGYGYHAPGHGHVPPVFQPPQPTPRSKYYGYGRGTWFNQNQRESGRPVYLPGHHYYLPPTHSYR